MEITHPDRVVYPDDGITKGEVAAYYGAVADRMLPFIAGRALSVERFPKGIGGQGFMQKNAPDHYPDSIRRHTVPRREGGTTTYPVVDDPEGIVLMANQGVITFHVPAVTVGDEEHLDWLIWDLDPPDGRVDLVRRAAREMRGFLDDRGLPTALMTSGSSGYHLRLRVGPAIVTDDGEQLARATAALAAAAHPDLLTVAFKKADRGDRVFVDWLRNSARATSVAPFSLRARRGAPVAAPLEWSELDEIAPDGITLRTLDDRSADGWAEAAVDVAPAAAAVSDEMEREGIVLETFDRFRS